MRLALVLLWLPLVVAAGCSPSTRVSFGSARDFTERRDVREPALLEAAAALDAGEPDDAFDRLVAWFKRPATQEARSRPEALYLAAAALAADGNTTRAFYYLDELLDTYPGSDLYRPAAARQYDIASAILADDRGFLDLGAETSDFDALEMLFRVQQRLPGSDLAERALLRSADHYFREEDYDFAEDAYTVFLEAYPRSEAVPQVRLRQAWSNLLQYEGPKYDPTPLIDARAQFLDLIESGQKQTPEIDRALAYVEEQFREKARIQAGFYRRTREPAAADRLLAEAGARYGGADDEDGNDGQN